MRTRTNAAAISCWTRLRPTNPVPPVTNAIRCMAAHHFSNQWGELSASARPAADELFGRAPIPIAAAIAVHARRRGTSLFRPAWTAAAIGQVPVFAVAALRVASRDGQPGSVTTKIALALARHCGGASRARHDDGHRTPAIASDRRRFGGERSFCRRRCFGGRCFGGGRCLGGTFCNSLYETQHAPSCAWQIEYAQR